MIIYTEALGKAVKKARMSYGLTQAQLADITDIDVRTIINIEKFRGNPKMEILIILIKVLRIDAREIFNPEMNCDSAGTEKLRYLVDECNDFEADALYPVVKSTLVAIRKSKIDYI